MNKQNIFFTGLVAVVATAIILLVIRRQSKRLLADPSDLLPNMAYSLWIVSIMAPFFILLGVALELIENAIEILIHDPKVNNVFFAVIQKIAVFIGFVFTAVLLLNFVSEWFCQLIFGKRDLAIEVKNRNISFFFLKAVLFIFLTLSIRPMFLHFLQWFMPSVDTPFYH